MWQHIKRIIYQDQMRFTARMQDLLNIQKSMNVIIHINRIKDKNHMTASTKVEKAFEEIQNVFMIGLC